MGIGKKIELCLKDRKMTVAQLARSAGISEQTIYTMIRRDAKTANVVTSKKIAAALDMNVSDLIDLYAVDALESSEVKRINDEWEPLFKRLGYGVGQPYACKDESGSIVEVELEKDGKIKTVSSSELFSIKKQAEEELKEVLNALIFEKTYEFLKSKKFDGDE